MSTLKAFKDYVQQVNPTDYRGLPSTGWFFGNNGIDYYFNYTGHNSSLKAYEQCPPVAAIINKKAQTLINGKTWILNTQGKAKGKEATGPEATKLRKLLAKPNALQSWKQFEAQGYIYQLLFGYNIVLLIKPVGFESNIDATALWNIPPFMVEIEETNKIFYQSQQSGIIKRIVINYKNTQSELNLKDVHIFKDFTPSFNSMVLPESRIKAIQLPINNIIGAYESRNVLINYRGALGIISHDPGSGQYGSLPVLPEDKKQIQEDFRRYGLKSSQWQLIITSAAIKWQQMGYATKDLMLFEEVEGSTMAICDSLGYPYRLMAAEKSASYNDVKEFEKQLYQDHTIPETESIYEQWNTLFGLSESGLILDKDFAHIAVLQADEQAKASARKARNEALEKELRYDLITFNRWRELNGEDTVTGGDIYFSEWVKINGDPMKPAPIQVNNNENGTGQNGQAKSNGVYQKVFD